MTTTSRLRVEGLSAGYGARRILDRVTLAPPPGRITAIVGANASGKSTLLRTMARLLPVAQGQVLLDGRSIHALPSRAVARELGLMPQSPVAPDGIAVADLVGRGRHPHHGFLSRWSAEDDRAVAEALDATGIADLSDRDVDTLSGGQRQRVWIAMALAQRTGILLLDEPTTFLDVAHQVEILDLLVDQVLARGTTVVMVLHDLNLAARYADHLVAIARGRLHDAGPPDRILTETLVREVFGLESRIVHDPVSGSPIVLPVGRHRTRAQ